MLSLLFIFFPSFSEAEDTSLEKDLQSRFEESRRIVVKAIEKVSAGSSASDEVSQPNTKVREIGATHLLLQAKFNRRDEDVKRRGQKAVARHQSMWDGYRQALQQYLSLIDGLPPDGTTSESQFENLAALLDKILHKKGRPLFGSLPYTHLNYPAQERASALTPHKGEALLEERGISMRNF